MDRSISSPETLGAEECGESAVSQDFGPNSVTITLIICPTNSGRQTCKFFCFDMIGADISFVHTAAHVFPSGYHAVILSGVTQ